MGRKSKWFTNVQPKLFLIKNYCMEGMTEATICKKIGVSHESFNQYKRKYPELVETLKNGKEGVDYAVENKLLKRAMGYSIKEVYTTTDVNGKKSTKETIKEIPPDVTAQIFWLKNRRKDKWRDRWDQEINSDFVNKNINQLADVMKKFTDDELKEFMDELQKK